MSSSAPTPKRNRPYTAAADANRQLQEMHGVNDAWNRFQLNYSPKDGRLKVREETI